jgi:hypothetical protein
MKSFEILQNVLLLCCKMCFVALNQAILARYPACGVGGRWARGGGCHRATRMDAGGIRVSGIFGVFLKSLYIRHSNKMYVTFTYSYSERF